MAITHPEDLFNRGGGTTSKSKFKDDPMVNSIIDSSESDMVEFFTDRENVTKTAQHVFNRAAYKRTVMTIHEKDPAVRLKVKVLKDQGEPWCWELRFKGRKEE